MTSLTMRGVRLGLMLAAVGAVVASPATGQSVRAQLPPGAVVQPLPQDDGAELRRHLTTLADNPRSLEALIGAGRAALDSGDGTAALSFFSRALEVSPRDARAKAGMASVMVRMERGQPALNLFAEAVALGAPELEVAGDRGLAYDMVGNPRRAQQDYAFVLQRREDGEIRRRLALSLAISGERDAALRVIDAQLRRNERPAWRTQAFVLALTGDAAGANRTAQGMMPAPAAQAMAPFFERLASLSPAQKAMAAHFGRFPTNGRVAAAPGNDTRADPNALALATGAQPLRTRTEPPQTVSREPRRRPGSAETQPGASRIRRPASSSRSAQQPAASPSVRQPVQMAQADSSRTQPPPDRREQSPPVQQPQVQPLETAQPASTNTAAPAGGGVPSSPAATGDSQSGPARPGFIQPSQLTRSEPQDDAPPRPLPVQEPSPFGPPTASVPPSSSGLSEVAALVATLPDDRSAGSRPSASNSSSPGPSQTASNARASAGRPAAQPSARRPAAPAHPSRHWVQIAGGANAAALPRELARLRQQAPELVRQTAWITPANATNRLLVGPFASAREAQEFVNSLSRRSVSSFAWTSPAGQEIHRLQAGR